ncbi:MAG: cysteine desulfurase family protein [Candidatus Gracilibacteria bacterium]|nr:cysteine desulfurase family protein [Candidatus Gracilibacteria bacterium]
MIYLDHAATTPTDPEVVEAMLPYFTEKFGNPSSIHSAGVAGKKALREARQTVAKYLNCKDKEIILTGSGTESDNLAIMGVCEAYLLREQKKGHIITSNFEHHAVLDCVKHLEKLQVFEATYLPVDKDGLIDPEDLRKAIKDNTVLVSIMYGNNEVGTIEPIKELAAVCHEKGVLFHTDACQAMGYLNVDVQELGVDLMTINGSKIYGPKGTGALYCREGIKLQRQIFGGGQEKGLRAGTENVPGLVGFAKAVEKAVSNYEQNYKEVKAMRDEMWKKMQQEVEGLTLNGHAEKRLPNNLNVSIAGIEGEAALLRLDAKGICASSGSACTSGSLEPSYVLKAIGLTDEKAHGSLRFTLGKSNTEEQIKEFVKAFKKVVEDLRKISAV